MKLIFRYYLSKYGKFRNAFTLTETIVGYLIGMILLASMLSWLVNLLYQDRNEQILSETQQNMERAMRYMTEDIHESVYVYDFLQNPYNSCSASASSPSCTNNAGNNYPNGNTLGYPLVGIPASLITANNIPIVAFWKLTPLTDGVLSGLNCGSLSTSAYILEDNPLTNNSSLSYQGECNALIYRRKMASLVVYFQKINVGDNSDIGWYGKSRILRYQFDKYNSSTTPTTRNNGFVDPNYSQDYGQWPENTSQTNLQAGITAPTTSATNPAVLLDYVDAPLSTADQNLPTCNSKQTRSPTYPTGPSNSPTGSYNGSYPTLYYSSSFWVCVTTVSIQDLDGTWSSAAGVPQIVSIYLRGNASGTPGQGTGINPVLQPLYSKVSVRGVVGESY